MLLSRYSICADFNEALAHQNPLQQNPEGPEAQQKKRFGQNTTTPLKLGQNKLPYHPNILEILKIGQHFLTATYGHQVDGFRARRRDQAGEGRGAKLREAEVHGGRQLHALRPGLVGGGAQHAADLVQLVGLTASEASARVSN